MVVILGVTFVVFCKLIVRSKVFAAQVADCQLFKVLPC